MNRGGLERSDRTKRRNFAARPEGRRAARLRSRRITAEAQALWRFGAQRQNQKTKFRGEARGPPSRAPQEQKDHGRSPGSMAVWSAATESKDEISRRGPRPAEPRASGAEGSGPKPRLYGGLERSDRIKRRNFAARPEGRRAARLRSRRITAEAQALWRFGAQRQNQKTKRRLLSRHLIPRPVRKGSTMGADSAVGDEAVVPLGAGPRSSRNTSVPVED